MTTSSQWNVILTSWVIAKLKAHFARHGSPDVVVSDNGPQYTSTRFKQFASNWKFDHRTSIPYNSQSNGMAEAAVKSIKRMMRKCQASKQDPYLGLLNLRNTPTEGLNTSPTQRLMGRRTRTLLLTTKALDPSTPQIEAPGIEAKRIKATEYHSHKPTLAPLSVGQ